MASNQDEGRRQAMLEKQRKDMLDDVARQKEALQQVCTCRPIMSPTYRA